jgi:hypothetical protein
MMNVLLTLCHSKIDTSIITKHYSFLYLLDQATAMEDTPYN